MELITILKAVLSLAFVIGLLLVTLWLIKYFQIKLQKHSLIRNLHKNNRLEIIENKKVDSKNALLLIRRDETEHLILLNPTQGQIIETNINRPASQLGFRGADGSSSTERKPAAYSLVREELSTGTNDSCPLKPNYEAGLRQKAKRNV